MTVESGVQQDSIKQFQVLYLGIWKTSNFTSFQSMISIFHMEFYLTFWISNLLVRHSSTNPDFEVCNLMIKSQLMVNHVILCSKKGSEWLIMKTTLKKQFDDGRASTNHSIHVRQRSHKLPIKPARKIQTKDPRTKIDFESSQKLIGCIAVSIIN